MTENEKPDLLTSLIKDYKKNFRYLKDDVEMERKGNIKDRILSVDFSEIFMYMFRTKRMRSDYKLLERIFSTEIKKTRDCKFVLMIPAIYELMKYYNSLHSMVIRYEDSNNIFNIDVVSKFYESYEEYKRIKIDDPLRLQRKGTYQKDINNAYNKVLANYNALSKFGSEQDNDVGSLAFLLNIFAPKGPDKYIDEPNKRFLNLIQKRTIMPLETAINDSHKIKNLRLDPQLSDLIFNDLERMRSSKLSNNNRIDADMGALCANFNKLFSPEKICMNVFSGSYIPNSVMFENRYKLGEIILPRCPLYALIRFSLYSKFVDDYDEIYKYANSCHIIYDNMTDIALKVKEVIDPNDINKNVTILKAAYYSMALLFYKYDVSSDMIQASREISINKELKSELELIIEQSGTDSHTNIDPFKEAEMDNIASAIEEKEQSKANYAKARASLEDIMESLYINLYDYVKYHDSNKISGGMYKDYNYMINKFKEEN